MSYSFVAAGTASSGSNTSRTPALPAGLAAGDYLLVLASIRNSGTGVPVAPAGYATLAASGNMAIFGKVAGSSEAAPTVTFTGGVANADTLAQTAAFRGYRPTLAASGTPTATTGTGSTALAYPASPTSTAGRVLAITAGWKQDDWASITGGPGTQIGTVVSTAGDDAAQVWNYVLARTTPATSGSWSTPGGVSATTRALVLHLLADPVITVTEQASWPPRLQVAVTSLDAGDNVEVYRVVAGQWAAVRAGSVVGITDPSFLVVDAEIPFGVPVRYAVYVNGFEYLTDLVTYDLPGGLVALSDAITGATAEAIIGSAGDRTYSRRAARFQVNGKNLVVSRPMGQGEGVYELLATSTSNRDGIMWLLEHCTQGIVQIRQAGTVGADGNTYDGVDAFLAVDEVTERRFSSDGSDPRRLIIIQFAETDGWSSDLVARGFTLGDIADYFGPSGTLQNIGDFFTPGTLLDLALADWTP